MAIIESDKLLHWNYFLAVEEDLHRLSRFVDFSTANFNTYSIEMVRILFAASAEVDVVAKQLCEKIQPSREAANIDHYRQIIKPHTPVLTMTHVEIPRHGLTLNPLASWAHVFFPICALVALGVAAWHPSDERLRWYLRGALVAGLFVILLFFHREQAAAGELTPNPSMLRLGAPFARDSLFWSHTGTFVYRLNEVSE